MTSSRAITKPVNSTRSGYIAEVNNHKWLPVWKQSFGEVCLGPPSDLLTNTVRAQSSGRSPVAYSLTLPASWIRSAATSKHTGTGATNKPMR